MRVAEKAEKKSEAEAEAEVRYQVRYQLRREGGLADNMNCISLTATTLTMTETQPRL